MSKRDVFAIADDAGIPGVHMAWPEGSAPPLPWLVFYIESQIGFMADNEVYAAAPRWVVELYQRSSDEELEERVESSITERFGPYTKSEAWVASENCLQTTYYFKELR